MAVKYGIKVVFCPKFHCELIVIEGLWCHQKQYVPSETDLIYSMTLKLMIESYAHFRDKRIDLECLRHFGAASKLRKTKMLTFKYCKCFSVIYVKEQTSVIRVLVTEN
jgi:hypothetical protein